ncbi:MAG TPA: hypothetical protein VOA80_04715 [Thermoanaerobaculia bacterium]|nr:hypothetical protein [Thermoanaerobaculia bacterium]
MDHTAQIDAVRDFVNARCPDRGRAQEILSELLHSVPAARKADGAHRRDLVIADHWKERHSSQAHELALEVSIGGPGEVHVAQEEKCLRAAPASLGLGRRRHQQHFMLWTLDGGDTWRSQASDSSVASCQAVSGVAMCASGMDLLRIHPPQGGSGPSSTADRLQSHPRADPGRSPGENADAIRGLVRPYHSKFVDYRSAGTTE